jgi:hypothetical protein
MTSIFNLNEKNIPEIFLQPGGGIPLKSVESFFDVSLTSVPQRRFVFCYQVCFCRITRLRKEMVPWLEAFISRFKLFIVKGF